MVDLAIARVAQSEFRKFLRFWVVAEKVHSARAKYSESKVEGGRGTGSSRIQYEKIRRFVQKSFFVRGIPRVQWGRGVGGGGSRRTE